MSRALTFLILPALMVSCANTQQVKIPETAQPSPAAVCGLAAAATNSTDTCFAQQAAMSDLFEIRSSELALERSESAAVKGFAQTIINDHTDASNKLKAKADKLNINLPTNLDAPKLADLQALQVKKGMAFDRAYAAVQVNAHMDAINLFEGYIKQGTNPELKAHAEATLPHLRHHLAMARELVKTVNP